MKDKKVPIIIPSYEPDAKLVNLCKDLIDFGLEDIIVVNDGSGQDYTEIFTTIEDSYKVVVLNHAVNRGKGRALKTALEYIIQERKDEDIIGFITADSDGQHTPKDIKLCIDHLHENPDSFILGIRDFDDKKVPLRSKLGNKITRLIFNFVSGLNIKDTQTGLRAIPKNLFRKALDIEGERFEYEMNMLLALDRFDSIMELPIDTVYESKTNHKSHFKTVSDSIKVYRNLLKDFVRYIMSSLSSTVLDFTIFYIMIRLLKSKLPFSYILISTIIARVISGVFNYYLNHKYVFSSDIRKRVTFTKYFLLAVFDMVASGILVTIIYNNILALPEVFVKVLVDFGMFFVGYYIQKKYIF